MLRTPLLALLVISTAPMLSSQVPRIDSKSALVIPATAPDGKMTIGTIKAADMLPDGGVVVADGSANQLLYFGADGTLAHRAGGNGEGPGEFRYLWGVVVCGGSVFGYEGGASVLERFDLAGNQLETMRLKQPYIATTPIACVGGNALAGMAGFQLTNSPDAKPPVVVAQTSITVVDLAGNVRYAVPVPRAMEMMWATQGGGMPCPLGFKLSIASIGNSVAFGTGEEASITVAGGAGLAEKRRLPLKARAATTADRQAAEATLLDGFPKDFRPVASAAFREVPMPDSLPYYREMLASPDGTVWLLTSAPSAARATWTVTDGRKLLGTVVLPVAGDLLAIGIDRVLIMSSDADGEQRLEVHRAER